MPFTFKITTAIDRMPELKKGLKDLAAKQLQVGFPSDKPRALESGQKAPRTKTGRFKKRVRNAEIAYMNEYGSPAQNIPPRPFMEPGIASADDAIVEGLTDAAMAALDGNKEGINMGFHKAGLKAVAGIRNYMTEGVAPPLSPITLRLRRMRGIHSTKPLIATGQLLNAVTYVVGKK